MKNKERIIVYVLLVAVFVASFGFLGSFVYNQLYIRLLDDHEAKRYTIATIGVSTSESTDIHIEETEDFSSDTLEELCELIETSPITYGILPSGYEVECEAYEGNLINIKVSGYDGSLCVSLANEITDAVDTIFLDYSEEMYAYTVFEALVIRAYMIYELSPKLIIGLGIGAGLFIGAAFVIWFECIYRKILKSMTVPQKADNNST